MKYQLIQILWASHSSQCIFGVPLSGVVTIIFLYLVAGPLCNRMFGNWVLLAGVVRLGFALSAPSLKYVITIFKSPASQHLDNVQFCLLILILQILIYSLYVITLFSFVLAFVHFTVEVWVTKTAPLGVATASPLLISGIPIAVVMAWTEVLNSII